MGMDALVFRKTDITEGINLCGTSLLLAHIVVVLSDILKNRKTKIINPVKVMGNGVEFMEIMIGGLLLMEGEKNFSDFPLSVEGVSLSGYFYEAVKELRLIEREIARPEKLSDFAKGIRNTLRIFSADSTAGIDEEEIFLAREFFSHLAEQFLDEYQAAVCATQMSDDDD